MTTEKHYFKKNLERQRLSLWYVPSLPITAALVPFSFSRDETMRTDLRDIVLATKVAA